MKDEKEEPSDDIQLSADDFDAIMRKALGVSAPTKADKPDKKRARSKEEKETKK